MPSRPFTVLAIVLALPCCTTPVHASPVSFKDGYGIMSSYSVDRFDTELNYSITSKHALGVSAINLLNYRAGTPRFQFLQSNFLLKRWNEVESQANLFLSLGLGSRQLDSDLSLAGLATVEGNFETRRIYTSLLAEQLQSDSGLNFTRARYRAGFSPFKAPIDSLNTWIIGQVEYSPDVQDTWTVTPLLRLFYNNTALEVGSSLEGDLFLGTMLHF